MTGARGWHALPSSLRDALKSGTTLVTPNNRLARRIAALYDGAQRTGGHVVWDAANVLPWSAWLERLWQDVAASGAAPLANCITPAQTAFLWKRIVEADRLPLIDEEGLATLASDAWSLVHAWGAGGASWRGWSGGDDDQQAFARWADRFAAGLTATDAIDRAQLPDWLVQHAPRVAAWRGVSVTLAGFIEMTPQQARLVDALVRAGMSVAHCESVGAAPGLAQRVIATTPRDEVTRALQWARGHILRDPGATVGIAIEDFGSRREEVRALAEEILCPALQLPGREDAARPYNLSLGAALSTVPLATTAIDLIALAHAPLPIGRAAALLRSPYLTAGSGDWIRRSQLERDWLGEGRNDTALDDVIAGLARVDHVLGERWREARDRLRRPSSATAREWTTFWRAWIEAMGWPGDRTLSSAEWQARNAWDELLAQFATLGRIAQRIRASEALAALRALAREHIFQPESAGAPVQILGTLEAAGLPLDALWVTGLASEVWPPSPRPNPLLPLAWQRERNAPHATAARELAYAESLTAQWARGAPDVVFSFAANVDDHVRSISRLVRPDIPLAEEAMPTQASRAPAPRNDLEALRDDDAPHVAPGTRIRGGTALIAAQSDCPFQAMARFRLAADRWPDPVAGLTPFERGKLMHAALASFWRDVRDQAALASLSPEALAAHIGAAADAAMAELPAARWRRVPPAVRAAEPARIASILHAWIDAYERPRPAFSVEATEARRGLVLGGLDLDFRVDRIDLLASGGSAIIDYKTGPAQTPAKWFDARPQAPQIGLYVLAERGQAPERPVRAAAYAQLKAGELEVRGIAADADAWPELRAPADLRSAELVDWPAIEAYWQRTLAALAREVRDGHAEVAPRDPRKVCPNCGRQPLCRIGATVADDALPENGDG